MYNIQIYIYTHVSQGPGHSQYILGRAIILYKHTAVSLVYAYLNILKSWSISESPGNSGLPESYRREGRGGGDRERGGVGGKGGRRQFKPLFLSLLLERRGYEASSSKARLGKVCEGCYIKARPTISAKMQPMLQTSTGVE